MRRIVLANDEYYHIYNRGAHKQDIFLGPEDCSRFQLLLHLSNTEEKIVLRDVFSRRAGIGYEDIFLEEKPSHSLVDVMAYCLMSNHFHLILRQKSENGISIFMKKVATAYAMSFNVKYGHSGALFEGCFKSKHVATEEYLRWLFVYVHFNPLKLIEPEWKEKGVNRHAEARDFLSKYLSSSYIDYCVKNRPERAIISYANAPEFAREQNDFETLIEWHQHIVDV